MHINGCKPVLDVWGGRIPKPGFSPEDAEKHESKAITIGWVIVEALTAPYTDETPTEEEKIKRWNLAQKFVSPDNPGLPVKVDPGEDIVTIKKLVAKRWPGPTIFARVKEAIDEGANLAAELPKSKRAA